MSGKRNLAPGLPHTIKARLCYYILILRVARVLACMLIDKHRRSNGMPKGPERRKTSPDVIGGMAKVVRIATGEETEELGQTPASAKPSRPLQPG
jgi:hypothetical protein